MYAADLDGDGHRDVLSASATDNTITWYRNNNDGTFSEQPAISTSFDEAHAVHTADLDGDGDEDVLSASFAGNTIAWFENEGGGNFSDEQVITTDAESATSVHAADLDGDGDKDVLSASLDDDRIAWYENEGSGTFSGPIDITTSALEAQSVYAADLDGDDDQDVLSASSADNTIAWFENEGGGNFSDEQVITTSAESATSVYAADVDGDGTNDVLSASFEDNAITWYENTGNGTFSGQTDITTEAEGATDVYAADLNGDGDQDVLSASFGDDKIAWYANQGGGTFSDQQIITTNAVGALSVHAADLTDDGIPDVLSASRDDNRVAWYENQPEGDLGDGLIARYPFDGSANDASGNENDGTLYGNPQFVDGQNGQAVSFDGDDDFVQTDSSPSLEVDGKLTFAAWIFVDLDEMSRKTLAVQGTNFDTDGNWEIRVRDDGSFTLGKNNVGGGARSDGSISTRQWRHVAITFSAGTTKFYIDGELDSEKDFGASSFNTTSDGIKIGDREYTGDETDDFKGEMDEVRLYDRALTGEEVQELYDGGGGISTSEVPLASSFRMPIGEVSDGEDLGNNLSLLERGYWPESGYPNLRFNDDGDQSPDTNEWYVATAHNKDESSIEPFDGDTAPYLESGAHHPGEDWNLTSGGSSDEGEPVLSAADGVVLHDGCVKNYGRTIILVHETTEGQFVTSFYAHLQDTSPFHSVGETIGKGETLGYIGGTNDADCSSGLVPHLHFEIRKQSMLDADELSNGLIELRYEAGMWPAAGRPDGGEYFIGANYYTPSDFIAARSDVAPTGLTAEAGDGEVILSWDANTDVDGYNVYRSTSSFSDPSSELKVTDSPVGDPSYTDGDVNQGTTYYYRVTAVGNDGNESPPSSQVYTSLQKLQLLGLEVNQSVQTWNNSVPLVEGKKTIVRVHLQNKSEGRTPVNVVLSGFQNGNLLEAPTLLNESYEAQPSPSPPEDSVELIRRRRADMEESLNFRLPESWTQKPSVTLKLLGQGIDCDKTPSMDENCETKIYFQETATPKITVFSVGWENGAGTTYFPNYDISAVENRVEAMYPVSDIDVTVGGRITITCPEDETCGPPSGKGGLPLISSRKTVKEKLESVWNEDYGDGVISVNHIYHGFVSEVNGTEGGAANIGGNVYYTVADPSEKYNKVQASISAHEIAHVFGLEHAVNEDVNGTNIWGDPAGYCGSHADDNLIPFNEPPTFPYAYSQVPDSLESRWENGMASLGPFPEDGGLYEEVWGVNTRTEKVISTYPHSPIFEDGSLTQNGELMSYCFLPSDNGAFPGIPWASDTTYVTLKEKINARFGPQEEPVIAGATSQPPSSRPIQTGSSVSSQEEEYLLVKGRINVLEDSLGFRSFSTITTSPVRADIIAPDSGDYTLQALDESGNVVEEVSFRPTIGVSKTISNVGTFTIPIQTESNIEKVQVLGGGEGNSLSPKSGAVASNDGDVLGSKSASPNPPTVTVQYPNGGEDLSGDEVALQWTADDPDGDSLSYTVKYSRNGGSTWKALATSWPHDSLTVDTDALGGTGNGLIRVQASDGFNTAQDESDAPFGTSNVPPDANIFSPSDGAVAGQTGLITLDGSGSDTEDGSLSGAALKWQTASGDSLGIGETIDVPAANFSLGTHTIELVATDSVGASDTASVSIQVSLSNDPSLLASASALVESDSLRDFGPTGTNIDFVGTSGASTVTAELYDSAPIGADGIPQSTVSHYRVLIQKQDGLTIGPETTVRFETDILGGINDPTEVQIYWRLAPSNGPFTALDTQVDSMGTPQDPSDDVIFAETSGFGEFVLASNSQPLPVELSDFDATLDGQDAVRLTWTTAQETGNAGFRVQRDAGEGGEGTWTTVGSVEGGGTTTEAKSYRYVDKDLPYEADRLTYRLKQVDTDGSASYSKEVTVERSVKEAQLLGTYPNPAQQRATVRYAVPERQDVKIYLYDILGRRVQTVVDGEREGRHKRQLSVSRLASGVYFLRLRAESATKTQRLTVVR